MTRATTCVKSAYSAPECEFSAAFAVSLICDSPSGSNEDYTTGGEITW